ncbi:MAG: AarF/UbiB family protein [Rhodocyclaceae bacterium]
MSPLSPATKAIAVIEKLYGRPVDAVFAEFGRTPVASASTAQVHFARLQDGTEVAIKVLRPGIERVIAHDMALLDAGATLLDLWPEGRRLKPREVVAEFAKRTCAMSSTLMREAANCSRLRQLHRLQVAGGARVWDYCGKSVMVMERMHGVLHLAHPRRCRRRARTCRRCRAQGEIFFTQVFRDGFFHADMHPGNIFVHADGRYIALDPGMWARSPMSTRTIWRRTSSRLLPARLPAVAQAHIDAGWVPASPPGWTSSESAIRARCASRSSTNR